MDGSWKEWAAALLTFLSGLSAIWVTWRSVRRKDLDQGRALERADGEQERADHQEALKQCWEFARKRETWYNAERQSNREAIERYEELIRALREEIHQTRNSWSEEQLRRVRMEEELKYLRAELDDCRGHRPAPEHPPPPPFGPSD